MQQTQTTILLDIYERLGAIENELKIISKEREADRIDISSLKEFKSRISAYIWLGGSIISGVLFFLWEGLKYTMDHWLFINH